MPYIEIDGTSYDQGANEEVIQVLNRFMISNRQNFSQTITAKNKRVRIDYGNPETGESHMALFNVEGYVGRTTGTIKRPVLCSKIDSLYGIEISEKNIVAIRKSNGGEVIYKHPNYHNKYDFENFKIEARNNGVKSWRSAFVLNKNTSEMECLFTERDINSTYKTLRKMKRFFS